MVSYQLKVAKPDLITICGFVNDEYQMQGTDSWAELK